MDARSSASGYGGDAPRVRRSRFGDADSSAAPRKSRFPDRERSRSPAPDRGSNYRERSPLNGSAEGSRTNDGDMTAAERAAKISADIAARTAAANKSDYVPSYRSYGEPISVTSDIYEEAGDYMKDIEINDLRVRFVLTKGEFHKMIKEETGCDITTRGTYYPDKKMAKASSPPLHLHLTCTSREGLEKAIAKIDERIQEGLPNLVDNRRIRPRREVEEVERDERGRRKWPETRIPIDLEPISGFNIRSRIVGHGGENVKWIQSTSGAKVQIKGFGSGYIEDGAESNEPMYLHIAAPTMDKVEAAEQMCHQLLEAVKKEYQAFKDNGHNRGHGGYGGRGGYGNGRGRGRGDRYQGGDRQHNRSPVNVYQPYQTQAYQIPQAPPSDAAPMQPGQVGAQPPVDQQQLEEYGRQIEEYYTGMYGYNPYAQYGGYVAYSRSAYGQQAGTPGQQPATSYPDGAAATTGVTAGYPTASYPDAAATYSAATTYPATAYPTTSYPDYSAYPTTAPATSYPDYSAYYASLANASATATATAPPPPPSGDAPPPPPGNDAPPPPPPGV